MPLACRECSREYPDGPSYICEDCFGPLRAIPPQGPVRREEIRAGPQSLWRYAPLLPLRPHPRRSLAAGWTPLSPAYRLGERVGLDELYVKNDAVNPSYSFKDRVVALGVAKALELGLPVLGCASTGNLANAVAAHAARAGLPAVVFVPADLEVPKIAACSVYGALVLAVDGDYGLANKLALQTAETTGWGFVNINLRPYYAEGSKTLVWEVVEQLGWQLPDHIVAPMAAGSMLTKQWEGLQQLLDAGLVEGPLRTRLSGAQAEGCGPIVRGLWNGGQIVPEEPRTIAKSLAIGMPADGPYALEAIRRSGGWGELASEAEIREGIRLLAETEGLFTETAGGVTVAVLRKLVQSGRIDRRERVVLYITGNGLKTVEAVPASVVPVGRSFQQVLAAVEALGERAAG